jgi:hypothetical protein
MQGKYLITTDSWFYAPDGKQYKAAWGDVQIVEDTFLGLKTNRNSTNWFAKVGSEQNHIVIAGCQIHYAVRCEEKPNTEASEDWEADAQNGIKLYERPTSIYVAQ